MNIRRARKLRDNLLEQLDIELGESTRLFIFQRDWLKKDAELSEEPNIDIKQRENSIKIKTITEDLLKTL